MRRSNEPTCLHMVFINFKIENDEYSKNKHEMIGGN